MDIRALYDALMKAGKTSEVEAVVHEFVSSNPFAELVPVGRRPNNRGAIEVATDSGRSLIERGTNGCDALLELEHKNHGGTPTCRSPREAGEAWLGVPSMKGLAGLTNHERGTLSKRLVLRLDDGDGSWQSRLVSVIDDGIGIAPGNLEGTILSLNESNKISKHYLAGTYGQGGSSTYTFSKRTVIASRYVDTDEIAFTVVWYRDLPADEFKTGQYVYLVVNGKPLVTKCEPSDFARGTIIKHFGFDLNTYRRSLGSGSVYGVLQRVMFDPVVPIRFENNVHGWNRVIKGVRNALNGAVDSGDDDAKGPDLDHHVPMFYVDLGEYGHVGIEYWVLKRKYDKDGKPIIPSDSFVDSRKPIILSHNGQNQGELSAAIIKKNADLPFLRTRLIAHINCDRLSPHAKRMLFSSTREQAREGYLQERIQQELVAGLVADDTLNLLNAQARDESLHAKDDSAKQQMRKQVAHLLRIHGKAKEDVGGSGAGAGEGKPTVKRSPRPKPEPINPSDPPTFVKLLWDDESSIPFYSGQRRYLRIETDADGSYHTPDKPETSRINVVVGDDLSKFGTSPLTGGRMRVGVECKSAVALGSKGTIRVELYRPGYPTLSDERPYEVVQQPEPPLKSSSADFPDFEVVAVDGPADSNWQYICQESDGDAMRHASGVEMSGGTLYIYYSTLFPRYTQERKRFELQNAAMAQSFDSRYATWLAVHSLLMHQDEEEREAKLDEEAAEALEREERCRVATVAALMAAQDVKAGAAALEAAEE
jgi:hypothetical protein